MFSFQSIKTQLEAEGKKLQPCTAIGVYIFQLRFYCSQEEWQLVSVFCVPGSVLNAFHGSFSEHLYNRSREQVLMAFLFISEARWGGVITSLGVHSLAQMDVGIWSAASSKRVPVLSQQVVPSKRCIISFQRHHSKGY